jgi:hypothetical protein
MIVRVRGSCLVRQKKVFGLAGPAAKGRLDTAVDEFHGTSRRE